ncbi:hypothetical protein ACROYT_G015937 [Oculina patagonica]
MSSLEETASETESDRYNSENEEYQIEVEAADCVFEPDESSTQEPYADEPIANAEWLANYRKEQEENDQLEKELQQRLENAVPVGECECYCCKELEGCCEALTSEIVQEDLEEGQELLCITEHPGFRPVCLEKWSLRLASGKYRTKAKQAYKKTGSEERYNGADANVHVVDDDTDNGADAQLSKQLKHKMTKQVNETVKAHKEGL